MARERICCCFLDSFSLISKILDLQSTQISHTLVFFGFQVDEQLWKITNIDLFQLWSSEEENHIAIEWRKKRFVEISHFSSFMPSFLGYSQSLWNREIDECKFQMNNIRNRRDQTIVSPLDEVKYSENPNWFYFWRHFSTKCRKNVDFWDKI